MTAISVKDLNKSFKSKQVLFDINLNFSKGDITALLGPSGSGKSTLLRHINSLTTADSGCIKIDEQTLQDQGKLSKNICQKRANIGFIFQQFNLVRRLSVLDNVLIGALGRISKFRGSLHMFTQQEKQQALDCLTRVGLGDLARQRASELSGGQQQRVAIAKVLMQQADIILADEPIASLDPESAKIVMSILRRLNEEDGKTVIITLHQVEYARDYCKQIVALKDGRIHYHGDINQLDDQFLDDLYKGSVFAKSNEELDLPAAKDKYIADTYAA